MAMRRLLCLTTLALAGCAGRPAFPVAPAPPVAVEPSPAPTPINAGLSPAAALWHLRAGLNVAAIACRGPGEAALVARYNALLAGHAAGLRAAEAAYLSEFRTAGGDWRDRYDDAQTRLYNFFGQARGRAGLCAAAEAAFAAIEGADDPALAAAAPEHLTALDRPFAPPRLEVSARALAESPAILVASR
ncbi:hypothetical protein [uncultured Sphingomonas sp.]|uniref:hypothetical protein n=1 Tax=uncultured Sphingomonas sp. TaxID=158754 RepID=UPI0035CCA4BA